MEPDKSTSVTSAALAKEVDNAEIFPLRISMSLLLPLGRVKPFSK